MKISKKSDKDCLTLCLDGRLDVNTFHILEEELENSLSGIKKLIIDFELLKYISSAGLRTLLAAQTKVNSSEIKMVLVNVNPSIMEIFDITGFIDFLTIE